MVRLRSPAPYGGFPERPKGADCKSVVTDFAGPNPASPTITKKPTLEVGFFVVACEFYSHRHCAHRAHMLLVRICRAERAKLACKRQARISSPLVNTQQNGVPAIADAPMKFALTGK